MFDVRLMFPGFGSGVQLSGFVLVRARAISEGWDRDKKIEDDIVDANEEGSLVDKRAIVFSHRKPRDNSASFVV